MHVRLRREIRSLKRDFPLRCPVSVRTFEGLHTHGCKEKIFGCVQKGPPTFEIWLERNMDVFVQIDTLWHEWTHCLLWPRCRVRHSQAFWDTYGRIYRHYQDDPK